MKNFRNLLFIFVFSFVVSFAFAQVDEMVEESTDTVVDAVDNVDLVDEEIQDENDELSGVEGLSIVSHQVDEESDIELHEEYNSIETINSGSGELTREEISYLLSRLAIGFCNEGEENISESLNAVMTSGVPFRTCLVVTNSSNKDVTLNLEFSDAGVDQYGNLICYAETSFSQYVKNADEINQFTVPANDYIIRNAEILYPIGIESNQFGCFAIWIEGEQNIGDSEGGVFLPLISRKGALAQYYVGSLGDMKNELKISNVDSFSNMDGDIILTFDVENIGNLENEIGIKGVIKNMFGFSKEFLFVRTGNTNNNIMAGRFRSFEVNIGKIPNYGGLFDIDFEVIGTPYFSYEVSDDFDKSLLEPLTYTEKTTYFEMPWLICIIVVIVIILLIVLFRKPKPQVVYVQAPQQPQQPQPQYQQPQYQNPQYQQPVNNQVPQQPQYQQPQQPMQQ